MLSLLLLTVAAQAATPDLPSAMSAAAERHGVPEKLLLALSWEASRWDAERASAWGGYGLFDLRDGASPSLEAAAMAADLDPDDVLARPDLQIDAAAALLAAHGARLGNGVAPPSDDLLAWWEPLQAFSGSHDPRMQERFAGSIYEIVNFGVDLDGDTGLELTPEPVNHWDRLPEPPPSACDYAGCARFTAASSSNYTNQSRGPSDISTVVIHTVQGSYSGCISWFQNPSASVSAHYVVRSSDGEVTQMVHEEDKGWHVGSENGYTVGIEHEGWVDDPGTWYTDAMYQASAALTADIADRNGIPIDRAFIVAHSELPNQTHTDPGSGWDWSLYMDYVNDFSSGGSASGNLIGVVADSDIYSGSRLPGVFVWVEETGESTTTDDEGYYRLYDLPIDSYTVHACMDGFAESTCSKDLSTGDNWCSIALMPGDGACSYDAGGSDGGDDGSDGTDGTDGTDGAADGSGGTDGSDSGGAGDGGGDDGVALEANEAGPPPGDRVSMGEPASGCGTVQRGVGALVLLWVAGFALVRARED